MPTSVALVLPAAAGATSSTTTVRRLLVTTADLPAGWTASPHDSTGDGETTQALARCVGTPVAVKRASVTGDDILDGAGKLRVVSDVAVYKSARVARKQFATYRSSQYGSCVKDFFANRPYGGSGGPLPTDVQVGKVSLEKAGQEAVSWALRADIPQEDGTTLSVYSVQSATLKGKAIFRTQFDGAGQQFPQDQREVVLANLAARIKKAKL